MGIFSGRYECKVDPKGRLALPARIKAAIPDFNGDTLVLRHGDDGCLALYPHVEFNKLLNQVNSLSDRDPLHRKIKRAFFEGMTEVELDSAGRFLIPKTFLQAAGIDKDASVNGMGSYVEIWNPDKYTANKIDDNDELTTLMDQNIL